MLFKAVQNFNLLGPSLLLGEPPSRGLLFVFSNMILALAA